jgi:two-component system, chemotaxis family, response regulator PixG
MCPESLLLDRLYYLDPIEAYLLLVNTNSLGKIDHSDLSFRDLIVQFKDIKAKTLSGHFIIQVGSTPSWMFSFNLGKLSWISGGIDPITRWQRNLDIANLHLSLNLPSEIGNRNNLLLKSHLLAQQLLAAETLFDIIQLCQQPNHRLSYQLISIDPDNIKLNPNLPLLDIQPILTTAIQSWQAWQTAGLAEYFPSQFLNIHQSEQLSAVINIDNLLELLLSIDGNRSLRNLAIYHRQNLLDFTKVLLPLLKSGTISLSPTQIDQTETTNIDSNIAHNQTGSLIACIDDSTLVYKNLEKFLTKQGYRSYSVQDPLKVIPTLIKNKPSLIFLDLLMPISNGYEVCEQIRKTPSLKDIPVVILTAKDGLFDRLRAKNIGANEFLRKPIAHADVLMVLRKYVDLVV